MGLEEVNKVLDDQAGNSDNVEGYTPDLPGTELAGGKRRRSRRTVKKSRKGKRVNKGKSAKKSRKTKGKKGASPWINHVKAFCKKTGKTFPEALKDPMCKKSFKK